MASIQKPVEVKRPSSEVWFLVSVGFGALIGGGVLLTASAGLGSTWLQATMIEFAGALVMVGLYELLFNFLFLTSRTRPWVLSAVVWLLLATGVVLLVKANLREWDWAQSAMIEMGAALVTFVLLEVRLVNMARKLDLINEMLQVLSTTVAVAAAKREGLDELETKHLVTLLRQMDIGRIPAENLPSLVNHEAARIRRSRGLIVVDYPWPSMPAAQRLHLRLGTLLFLAGIIVLFGASYVSGWAQAVAIETAGALVLVAILDLMLTGLVPRWTRPLRTFLVMILVLVLPGIVLILAARSREAGWGQSVMLEFGAGFVAFVVLVYIVQFVRSLFESLDMASFVIAVARVAAKAEGLSQGQTTQLITSISRVRMGPTASDQDLISYIRRQAAAIRAQVSDNG